MFREGKFVCAYVLSPLHCTEVRFPSFLSGGFTTIRMSHWHQQMVDGAEFWISCKWLKPLRKASQWQLIQCSAPSTICWCQCDIRIGCAIWYVDFRYCYDSSNCNNEICTLIIKCGNYVFFYDFGKTLQKQNDVFNLKFVFVNQSSKVWHGNLVFCFKSIIIPSTIHLAFSIANDKLEVSSSDKFSKRRIFFP